MSAALRLVYDADIAPSPEFGSGPPGGGPALIDCGECHSEEWTIWDDGTVGCARCGTEYTHAEMMEL